MMNRRRSRVLLRLAIPAVAVAIAAVPPASAPAATTTPTPMFGRMFPALASYTTPSVQNLQDLAQTQLDDGTAAFNNPGVTAGFTYFGQFLDHDTTRDQQPNPTSFIDPTTLQNFRTPAFDLDSVYGAGPTGSPQLYNGNKLKLQATNENGVPDLPRRADGSAIIADNRNDENLIIAQIQLAVIKFHNKLIDQGMGFDKAQRLTRWHYQWVIVHDYLPHVAGQDRVDRFLNGTTFTKEFYNAGYPKKSMTPVEFSSAAFRFGHSQVRNAYRINSTSGFVVVFSPTGGPDLHGGREIPAGLQINWNNFFQVHGSAPFAGNISRKIDTKISASLFNLPIPGAADSGSNVLGFRNLTRGLFYGLPSGQDVSTAMGITPLTNEQLGLGSEFGTGAPLWYYTLAEAEQRENGTRLGDMGGRIVAEYFLEQLARDPKSYLNNATPWTPTVPHTGAFDISEFLKFAGVVQAQP